jgi:hypothetical protein
MTALPNSRSEGAASAAPSSLTDARLIALDKEIDQATDQGIRARWEFGRILLHERVGKKLPNGRLAALAETTGKSESELKHRMNFAQRFPDEAALANAISQWGSWYAIVNRGLAKKTESGEAKSKSRPAGSTLKGKAGLSHDPEVVEWVRVKIRASWDRDRIVAVSKAGADGWPRPGKSLSNGGVSECRAAIAALERMEGEVNHHPSGATSRLKLISAARKKDPGRLWDLRYQLMKIVGWLAQLDLLEWGIDQWEREGIYDLWDDLVLLDEWNTRALARAATYIDDDGIREKIRKMRENQTGRTDAEKANIKRRIAALEHRLENKLSK